MLFILPKGPIPTYFYGDMIFTKLKPDCFAKLEAIVVVPDPCLPYNNTAFNLFEPLNVRLALLLSF